MTLQAIIIKAMNSGPNSQVTNSLSYMVLVLLVRKKYKLNQLLQSGVEYGQNAQITDIIVLTAYN